MAQAEPVRNRLLIVETDPDTIQSDRPINMHHQGDLLRGLRLPSTAVKKPCSGRHSSLPTGRNQLNHRRIQA